MKKIRLLIIAFICILSYVSCKHDSLDLYSAGNDIYFQFGAESNSTLDSIKINLGYDKIPKQDSIIFIKMKLFGFVESFDRPINYTIEYADNATTAILDEEFEPLYEKSFLPANSDIGYIALRLINTESLKLETRRITIKTAPNEYFPAIYSQLAKESENKKGKVKSNIYKVVFDAKLNMPNMWADYEKTFTTVFGTYSNMKFNFICEAIGFERDYFTYKPEEGEVVSVIYNERFPATLRNGWKQILKRALVDYEQINGEPLTDENGKKVTFPS